MARPRRLRRLAAVLVAAGACARLSGMAPAPLALGGGHVLVPGATVVDDQGRTHVRMQHRYRGLRVWGSETLLHPDDPGRPGLASLALPEPAGPGPAAPDLAVDTTPSLPLAAALEAIRERLGPAGLSAQLTPLETVIYPLLEDYPTTPPGAVPNAARMLHYPAGYVLAYRVRALPLDDGAGEPPWEFLLDAHTGAELLRLPLRMEDGPAEAVGQTLYSGTQALDVLEQDGQYRLADPTRPASGRLGDYGGNAVVDLGGATQAPGQLAGRSQALWGNGQVTWVWTWPGSATWDTVAADAAFGLQVAWDYFRRIHGRNGYDGLGTALTVRVHPAGSRDNAYWDPDNYIQIGEGFNYWPRSSPGTLAHEFAHGVTGTSAGLVYAGEPGGLNEATSDIFGAMAPAWFLNGSGATIGVDNILWTVDKWRDGSDGRGERSTSRSMVKPSLNRSSPDAWSSRLRDLDPHDASGPMNRAFYFLSQGASADRGDASWSQDLPDGMFGIGNDKAARIWYRTLTTRLGPRSTYRDARMGALRAAAELYGVGSAEHVAVHKAFGAIRVGDPEAPLDDVEPPTVTATATLAGARLTLAADAHDNDRVASVTYLVDNLPFATATAEPYTVTLDTARLLGNGDHAVVALALDPTGNQGASAAVPLRLANPYQQVLLDPGLEGPAEGPPWLQSGPAPVRPVSDDFATSRPHGGQQYALLGWSGQELYQDVAVPAGVTAATLEFWVNVTTGSRDAAGTLTASVTPAPGEAPAAAPATRVIGAGDNRDDWVRHRLDVTALAGRRVRVRFAREARNGRDLGLSSQFRIDDVTLVCGAAPVAVAVTPASLDLPVGTSSAPLAATVTGSADGAVAWSVREAGGGTLDADRRYTAPATRGFYHVIATAQADPGASAEVSVRVLPEISVSPERARLTVNGTLALALRLAPGVQDLVLVLRDGAGTAVRTPGSDTVVYTAPGTPGIYFLGIRKAGSPYDAASVLLDVRPEVAIAFRPAAITVAAGYTTFLDVSAHPASGLDLRIAEGPAGGSLSTAYAGPDDLRPDYTAPAEPGVYHLVAASTLNPAFQATLTVTVRPGLVIDPPEARLAPGARLTLRASRAGETGTFGGVAWTVDPSGALFPVGSLAELTAPERPGTLVVTARAGTDPELAATARITVQAADPDGDGRTAWSFGDLAALADAYGTRAAPGQHLAADLNGDGTVDDDDLAAQLAVFERPGAGAPRPRAGTAGR